MCGIAGTYIIDTGKCDINAELTTKLMIEKLTHRGPESCNFKSQPSWSLAISRLSIVGLNCKNNVFTAAEGKITYVVNGEIFNYKELRRLLISKGYVFRSECDSEVIGFLYEEFGVEFVHMLNGQFAIAIIDEREEKLLLVRDRFGIVPLYYYYDGKKCYFSSEICGFNELVDVEKKFNYRALDQLFTFWTTIGKYTFIRDIYQVQPSHFVEISSFGIKEKKYYNLNLCENNIDNDLTFEEAKEKLVYLLSEAVKIRLESSDVEVGTYLSGGVDSSIITKMCESFKKGGLRTFSVSFSDELFNEKRYQEDLMKQSSSINKIINIEYKDIFDNFENAVKNAGQPIFRTAIVPLYILSRYVKESGIKVVLTGEGADEVFWGYDIFRELKVRKFWKKDPSSTIRPLLFKKLYSQFPQFDKQYHQFVSSFYSKTLSYEDQDFYSHLVRWGNNSSIKAVLSKETKDIFGKYSCVEEYRASLPGQFRKYSDLSKCQLVEMDTLLQGYLLSSQGDRMSFANSVESRIPFLDHNVVEFAATLPPEYKLNSLRDKYILREAFKELLPSSIYSRAKHAYQAPEITSFLRYAKGSYVEHLLSPEVTKEVGIFDERKVSNLLRIALNTERDVKTLSTTTNMAFVQVLSTNIFYSNYIKKLL